MPPRSATLSRRTFLQRTALAGTALLLPDLVRADPYRRLPVVRPPAEPVRVRGRVRAGGQGLAGVPVTDGLTIVTTNDDGDFELVSSTRQPFVYLSVPAGYAIPQNPTGTARFYEPLAPDAAGAMEAVFDLAPLPQSDEDHAFLVLADTQTQNTFETGRLHDETVPDIQATLKALGDVPTFGVSCGDIMYDDLALYPEYERAVQRMGLPFFQVVGNHDLNFDLTDEASVRTFSEHFGPPNYSFDRGQVHYVVLDDVFWQGDAYLGYLNADQLTWLEHDLARVEAGRPVVVFVHIPALSTHFRRLGEGSPDASVSITNREALYRLLEPYDAHVISGHTHEHEHVFEGGVHEHVLGTVCGAWWSGDICWDGTPNGYGTFEVRGADLRWRYQATGQAPDHQMRVHPHGADPTAPDEIVANVWDWDPAWTVVWYEDGDRRGTMARRLGIDPLAEALQRGPDLPPRREWVEPRINDHMFYAPAARTAQRIVVEATDRFGRTYAAALDDET